MRRSLLVLTLASCTPTPPSASTPPSAPTIIVAAASVAPPPTTAEARTWDDVRRRLIDSSVFLCRILEGGRVGCWGFPDRGKAFVLPGDQRFVSVATGLNYPSARTSEGALFSWGARADPIAAVLRTIDQRMLAEGGMSTALLHLGGLVHHTDGTDDINHQVEGLTKVRFVAAQSETFGAITDSGALVLFYRLGGNMLGIEPGDNLVPIPLSGPAFHVDLQTTRGCAVVGHSESNPSVPTPGDVYCWGEAAESMSKIPLPPTWRVAVGLHHACALTQDEGVWCWGTNDKGQLGQGHLRAVTGPKQVSLPGPMLDITEQEGDSMCAVDAKHTYCWGGEEHGPSPKRLAVPTVVYGAASDAEM